VNLEKKRKKFGNFFLSEYNFIQTKKNHTHREKAKIGFILF
jgi:hypothetical protein